MITSIRDGDRSVTLVGEVRNKLRYVIRFNQVKSSLRALDSGMSFNILQFRSPRKKMSLP